MGGFLRARVVRESGMRSQPGPIHLRIITFDQSDFLRCLIREVIPLVVGIVLHAEDTANSVGVDELHGHQIVLGVKVTPVRDGKGKMGDWVTNGPPDVDDANATFEQTFSIFTEMVVDTSDAGVVRLIDVNAFGGSAGYFTWYLRSSGLASNSMIENKDSLCACFFL